MKAKYLFSNSALAAALAVSGAAQAGTDLQLDPAGPVDYEVYIDGGDAASDLLLSFLINEVCIDGVPASPPTLPSSDIDVFEDEDGEFILNCNVGGDITGDATDHPGFGTPYVDGNTVTVASNNVTFIKRNGSAYDATVPLASATAVSFPDPASIDLLNCDPVEQETTGDLDGRNVAQDGDGTGAALEADIDGVDYNEYDCTTTRTNAVADFGISEVEGAQFASAVNRPLGAPAFTSATGAALTSVGTSAAGVSGNLVASYSFAATKSLFMALQASQFGEAYESAEDALDDGDITLVEFNAIVSTFPEACFPGGPYYTFPDEEGSPFAESQLCLPTLTEAEILGIVTGQIAEITEGFIAEGEELIEIANESNEACDGNADGVPDNTQPGDALAVPPVPASSCELIAVAEKSFTEGGVIWGPNPAVDDIDDEKPHYCRSAPGTGPDVAVNAALVRDGCTANVAGQTSDTLGFGINETIVAGNSNEVAACLDDLENGTNNSGLFGGVPFVSPAPRQAWGIGVVPATLNTLDADDGETRADLDDWRYIRLGRGGTPTNAAKWQADYGLFSEAVCNRRADNSFNSSVTGAEDTDVISIFNQVCTPDPIQLAHAIVNFEHLWADDDETNVAWALNPDGVAATSDAAFVFVEDEDPGEFEGKYDRTNPTITMVRRGNTCAPAIVAEPTEIDIDEE